MQQQQQIPIGVIVPLFTAANDSGVYELADIARRYSVRVSMIVVVPINHPNYTDQDLDNAIAMLDTAGARVVGLLPVQDYDTENKQLIMAYKKYYPKLAGVAFMPPGDDENITQRIANLAIFAKETAGFTLTISVVLVMDIDTDSSIEAVQATANAGFRYFELTPPGAIDIVLYDFFKGLPRQLSSFHHERYQPSKFGFAVSRYRIQDVDAFRRMIKAVVNDFRIARYVYVEGGKDTVAEYGPRASFTSLSPYTEITAQTLDRIAMTEERLNSLRKTKTKQRTLLSEKQAEIVYDDFGIRKVNKDVGWRNTVNVPDNKFVIALKGMAHYTVDKPSILQGVHSRTFKGKEVYQNLEWTTYIKLTDTVRKKTVFNPEDVMYQFVLSFGKKGDNTYYDVNITYGGFVRVGKCVAGTKGLYRLGNGTNYPLTNWLGFKVTYHQFSDPTGENNKNNCRVELWMDEHAQDASGNLVITNNQADRWRNVFSTDDTGNWTMYAKRPDSKTVRNRTKGISPMKVLQRPITGPILACILKLSPQIKADVKFMTMREVEPLRED